MNDKDKEQIEKTIDDILLTLRVITEAVVALSQRVENLEVVVIEIAKLQGGGKDIINPN